jgi:site-specific recombinase XerD
MGQPLDTDVIEHLFWMRDVRNLSPNTISMRRGVLDRLSDTIGMPLREAQIGHLQRWQSLVLTGKAAESKRAYISHVSAFYGWLVRRGIIADNPAALLDRPKVPKGLPHPIAEDDLALALANARPKLHAMITLTADAGLRCCEIARLHFSDIQRRGGGWILFIRGKGRKERIVPVGEEVVRAIRGYRWASRGPVFLGRDGGQITPNAVSQAINYHYAKLGVSATAHHGRHRYVSTGVEELGDVVLMQHLAGHESLATTQIYAAFSPDKAARLVAALDERARARKIPIPRPAAPLPPSSAGRASATERNAS